MNIKLAAYYLRKSEKISQVCQPTDLTVQAICTITELCDSDSNWDDPKAPMINERDWSKTLDGIDEFFHECYGITSIPLAYIIRKDSTPKEGEETGWDDPLEQMIERAHHTITEANGTIIKHPTLWQIIKCFLRSLLNQPENMIAGLTSSLMQEPEMEGQPTCFQKPLPWTQQYWQHGCYS